MRHIQTSFGFRGLFGLEEVTPGAAAWVPQNLGPPLRAGDKPPVAKPPVADPPFKLVNDGFNIMELKADPTALLDRGPPLKPPPKPEPEVIFVEREAEAEQSWWGKIWPKYQTEILAGAGALVLVLIVATAPPGRVQ